MSADEMRRRGLVPCGLCLRLVSLCELVEGRCPSCRQRDHQAEADRGC